MTKSQALNAIKGYVRFIRVDGGNQHYAENVNSLILEHNISAEELIYFLNGLPGPRPRPLSGKWNAEDVGEFWPKTLATPLHAQWVVDALKMFSKGTRVDAVKLAKAINDGKFSPPP